MFTRLRIKGNKSQYITVASAAPSLKHSWHHCLELVTRFLGHTDRGQCVLQLFICMQTEQQRPTHFRGFSLHTVRQRPVQFTGLKLHEKSTTETPADSHLRFRVQMVSSTDGCYV